MENDILDSLNDIGYAGPLTDETALSAALSAGPKSLEYTKLVHVLAEELQQLCRLEETVHLMSSADDSSSFLLELSSFLKELGCPYKKMITGHISARLQTREERILLLDYLLSELMAARMVNVERPAPADSMNIVVQESPTAKDLKEVLIALKFNKPPPNITAEILFNKLYTKLKETIDKEGANFVGKPLYNKTLSEKEWKELESAFTEMLEEYRLRRETLITRLECTIQSFEWSERMKSKKEEIQSAYRPHREAMRTKPDVRLPHFLAARSALLHVEKTSSAAVRTGTRSEINKLIIGRVPDRGGRPSEQQPPPPEMPSWQQRPQEAALSKETILKSNSELEVAEEQIDEVSNINNWSEQVQRNECAIIGQFIANELDKLDEQRREWVMNEIRNILHLEKTRQDVDSERESTPSPTLLPQISPVPKPLPVQLVAVSSITYPSMKRSSEVQPASKRQKIELNERPSSTPATLPSTSQQLRLGDFASCPRVDKATSCSRVSNVDATMNPPDSVPAALPVGEFSKNNQGGGGGRGGRGGERGGRGGGRGGERGGRGGERGGRGGGGERGGRGGGGRVQGGWSGGAASAGGDQGRGSSAASNYNSRPSTGHGGFQTFEVPPGGYSQNGQSSGYSSGGYAGQSAGGYSQGYGQSQGSAQGGYAQGGTGYSQNSGYDQAGYQQQQKAGYQTGYQSSGYQSSGRGYQNEHDDRTSDNRGEQRGRSNYSRGGRR